MMPFDEFLDCLAYTNLKVWFEILFCYFRLTRCYVTYLLSLFLSFSGAKFEQYELKSKKYRGRSYPKRDYEASV
jgi:hypothetical protein